MNPARCTATVDSDARLRILNGIALSLAFATLVACLSMLAPTPATAADIFIDPGHGGRYPGAVYGGIEEQYVNMLIAAETRRVLESRGHNVAMSRYGDITVATADRPTWHWDSASGTYHLYKDGRTGVYSNDGSSGGVPYDDLQARCDKANTWGAEVFLSIHNNAAGSSARGTESYYHSWDNATDAILGQRLADYVQQGVVSAAGTASDRGVDDAGFYVLRWANMPSALIEVGFLSDASDRALLLSSSYRYRVAVGIANGIERYLASDPYRAREPRIEGDNRYATAVAAAGVGWPDGAETVLLASGEQWPDSLAADPLSLAWDAPILLTPSTRLAPEAAAELRRLQPSRIVVLGGDAAVATATVDAATAAAGLAITDVERIAGRDRYETAALIARELGVANGTVMIVSGEAYPDAVSGASLASMSRTPILLTRGTALPPATRSFLEAHSEETSEAIVIGGPPTITTDVTDALSELSAVTWVYGRDRYATNLAVIKRFWPSGSIQPYVATGVNFPDALVAGALAGDDGQPILLCGRASLPAPTREWIMHNDDRIGSFTMMGSPAALSRVLEWEFLKARGD